MRHGSVEVTATAVTTEDTEGTENGGGTLEGEAGDSVHKTGHVEIDQEPEVLA